MRLAYFDCFAGISGHMALGALVDAGADLDAISEALASLPVGSALFERERIDVHGLSATRIHIRSRPEAVIHTYGSIRSILDQADLPDEVRRTSQRIFRRLAEAEARVHSKEIDVVTFHEYGDIEALASIVGCAVALHELAIERVYSSPIPTGMGMARTDHGMMPIPSPEVMDILQGVPSFSRGIPIELTTPTGAAILTAVAEGYGDMPLMRSERVGYGAGLYRLDFPHVVRLIVGEELQTASERTAPQRDLLLQTNIVDRSGGISELLAGLLSLGARDVWTAEVHLHDGTPATRVSVVAPVERGAAIADRLAAHDGAGPVGSVPFDIQL